MKAWKYYRGEWTEILDPLVWGEDEAWESVLERAGYERYPMTTLGDAGGSPAVEVYQKKEGDPSYLITFCLDGSRIEDVYIDELPSLMQWLRDYTPFLLLEQLAYELGELRILGTKAFRTWHQHDYVGVCPNCDPDGWRQLQEYRQKRLQKKTGV